MRKGEAAREDRSAEGEDLALKVLQLMEGIEHTLSILRGTMNDMGRTNPGMGPINAATKMRWQTDVESAVNVLESFIQAF